MTLRWLPILAIGVAVAFADEPTWTALHAAVDQGDQVAVERILRRQPTLLDAPEAGGHTPLHLAAGNGNAKMTKLLLDHGADIEAQDTCGWTPLHTAVSGNRPVVVRLLLDRKAAINAKDRRGQTPLRLAEKSGHKDLVELLQRHGAKE